MSNTIQILENITITDFDIGTVFGGTPSGKMVRGYAVPLLFTPAGGVRA